MNKKLLIIFAISLIVTGLGLSLMYAVAIKGNRASNCCDQLSLERSYGFPLPFKQVYSGGLAGKGETINNSNNAAIDGVIIFVTTAAVLSVVSFTRKDSKHASRPAIKK